MTIKRKLPGFMNFYEKIASTSAEAMDVAKSATTKSTGSISVQNGDGSYTIVGSVAGSDSTETARSTVRIGDTTPPGIPTGISVDSTSGILIVSWDGTLKDGVPSDFYQVTIFAKADNATLILGKLTKAGSLTSAAFTSGTEVEIWACSEDDNCNADGTSAHNVSDDTDHLNVTISKTATEEAQQAATIAISATHGRIFKNSSGSTTLNITIFQPGGNIITTQTELVTAFGSSAHLEWQWRKDDSTTWNTILLTDSKISNAGFSLTVTSDDVDEETSFRAQIVI